MLKQTVAFLSGLALATSAYATPVQVTGVVGYTHSGHSAFCWTMKSVLSAQTVPQNKSQVAKTVKIPAGQGFANPIGNIMQNRSIHDSHINGSFVSFVVDLDDTSKATVCHNQDQGLPAQYINGDVDD